jgi:hypothetical protein
MSNQIKNEGELDLNGFKISCYVLDNGTRVLSGRGLQNALKMEDDKDVGKQTSGSRLKRYLTQKSLKPFIYNDKEVGHFNPIICYKGDSKINGYEATILADICDGILEARKHISLSKRQEIIATQCEILMRAFAKIGIIALVDEATGYQYDRERFELQKILKAYISAELLQWQKTFPNTYYQEIFRLNGWDYTVRNIKYKPQIVGKWTNKVIYDQLPKGVLDELKKKTPKNQSGNYTARFFQSLTADTGSPHLTAQLNQIIAIMRISDNWKQFISNFNKMVSRKSGQLELKFEDLAPDPEPKEKKSYEFDKHLKGLMKVKPPKNNKSLNNEYQTNLFENET